MLYGAGLAASNTENKTADNPAMPQTMLYGATLVPYPALLLAGTSSSKEAASVRGAWVTTTRHRSLKGALRLELIGT
jgi:hypothetical protein